MAGVFLLNLISDIRIARDMEDDALGFDPITLLPRAQPAHEPKVDLEAEVPETAKASPRVEEDIASAHEEPTEQEMAEAVTDSDMPTDLGEFDGDEELHPAFNFEE